ncbi:hypothetical protein ZIOFF_073248 [Zingiber officinale]|uniref:FLZ-type domain-containing protein n=1 Tax=Zingiber officinale TaxID=94328 RepID=A0A8J5C747_ZINOF|nr:hypothetical protein ZIOFF_073248 [Zingiber officinale]
MSDLHSLPSSNSCCCNKSRDFSIFPSPRLFVGVSSSTSSDSEAAMSPTSIPETKSLPSIGLHLFFDAAKSVAERTTDTLDHLVTPRLLASLKIRIPSLWPGSMSPVGSPIEFGVKNKESQLALLSPAWNSLGFEMPISSSPRVFAGCVSISDMELLEEYTCVISHGPNPRTTHIFDNCIVESCRDGFTASTESSSPASSDSRDHLTNDFLSFYYTCKKNLSQGNDNFISRGEKAFCSSECHKEEKLGAVLFAIVVSIGNLLQGWDNATLAETDPSEIKGVVEYTSSVQWLTCHDSLLLYGIWNVTKAKSRLEINA